MKVQKKLSQNSDFAYRLTILNEMTKMMNLSVNEAEVYHVASLYTADILQADRTSIALVDESKTHFNLVTLEGEAGFIPVGKPVPVINTLI